MSKNMIKCLLLAVFMLLPLFGARATQVDDVSFFQPSLRVGLLTNQPRVQVSADADFDLADANTGKVLASFRARHPVTVSIKNGALFANDRKLKAASIDVVVKKNNDLYYLEQLVRVNERRYRGDITIRRTTGNPGMTIINTVQLEEYLYGVIKNEISPDWPLEAVKAQAVAARTYALASTNKHKDDGYDVCPTVHCQVYGGRESEAPRSLEAVDATRGLVLLHSGKLITALFHSSSGGYTENSENVWSSPLPYIRGVEDFDQNSPTFKWEKKLTVAELERAISQAGYKIGKLKSVELSQLKKAPAASKDRGISGRVKTIDVQGTAGRVQIPGTKLRTMLDLKSTLFDIDTGLPVKGNSTIRRVSGRTGDAIVISGYGWGHGLGLSQWGAKAMAEKASPRDTEYFKTILKHYYQGVQIIKAYI